MDSPDPNLPRPDAATAMEPLPAAPLEAQAPVVDVPATGEQSVPSLVPRPYDFRRPALLSANELRHLRAQYEEFLSRVGTRLTNYLRLEVELKLTSIETISFHNFVHTLPAPTHLTLFKIEPLRGICVIEVSSILGLALFDRLMGGTGQCTTRSRELSEIEAALIDHVVQLILDDWCASCTKPQHCKPVLLGHETDGRYLQTSPPESMMFVACAEVSLAQITERIQIVFPLSTLEPCIRHLRETAKGTAESAPEIITPRPLQWNNALEDVSISVTAELPVFQTPARVVARLKVGDLLPLPSEFANRVHIRLAGILRLTGRLGTRDGRWAIEATHILKSRSVPQL